MCNFSSGFSCRSSADPSVPPDDQSSGTGRLAGPSSGISVSTSLRSYEVWPHAWREELFFLLKTYHPGNRGSIAWDAIMADMKQFDATFNRTKEKLMEFRKNSLATLREVLRKMGVGDSGGAGGFEFREEWQKLAYEVRIGPDIYI